VTQGSLTVGDANLIYGDYGQGDPLLLIHGGLGDRSMWDGQIQAFSARYRTVVPDLRGFGDSAPVPGSFSWTEDLRALMRHLDLGPTHVVGLSLGGSIAVDLVESYPELVRSLVLVGSGLRGFKWSAEERARMEEADESGEGGDIAQAVELELQFWIDGRRPPGAMDQEIRERVRTMNQRAWETPDAGAEPRFLQDSPRDLLARVQVPALIVLGEHDVQGIHTIGSVLASEIPAAETIIVPGAAHHPQMEQPAEFNRIVLDFLARLH
jgi:3-oxoadipate enol-lactonase